MGCDRLHGQVHARRFLDLPCFQAFNLLATLLELPRPLLSEIEGVQVRALAWSHDHMTPTEHVST